jgi:hypothetical protein
LDRYVPDCDRDDACLRNQERERERDVERDKTRRSSLNPRDGTTGDDQINWRRPPPGSTTGGPSVNNNSTKRSTSYQANNLSRVNNKDTPNSRDHSAREKEREKTITSKHPQSSNHANQNNNQQQARDKENTSSSQLASNTPPISPDVPLTSHASRRVKDGAWDSGEGKWEISKPSNGQSGHGYGTSKTDAIQAWKAEMKALEAQKKLAAASSLSAVDSQDDSSKAAEDMREPKRPTTTLDTHSVAAPVKGISKLDRDCQLTPRKKEFDFTAIGTSPIPDEHDGAGSHHHHHLNENDLVVLPRASRFAKFFDHHKDGAQQTGPTSKNDHHPGREIPTKAAGSPSADPENMACVLSMLQMSSKVSNNSPQIPYPSSDPSDSHHLMTITYHRL